MVINAEGCIIHMKIEWKECRDGHQLWECTSCGAPFIEFEDTGCGG